MEDKINHNQETKSKDMVEIANRKDNHAHEEFDSSPDTDILLIRRYNKFSNKCVAEGMRNFKEITELFRVREELRLA